VKGERRSMGQKGATGERGLQNMEKLN